MNVLRDIPYNDEIMGKRKIIDEKHILAMQIALKPGQVVPRHNANSNVHLLVLRGSITVTLEGAVNELEEGGFIPVAFKSPMEIKNTGSEGATFLVLKTPNPAEVSKKEAL